MITALYKCFTFLLACIHSVIMNKWARQTNKYLRRILPKFVNGWEPSFRLYFKELKIAHHQIITLLKTNEKKDGRPYILSTRRVDVSVANQRTCFISASGPIGFADADGDRLRHTRRDLTSQTTTSTQSVTWYTTQPVRAGQLRDKLGHWL